MIDQIAGYSMIVVSIGVLLYFPWKWSREDDNNNNNQS
jgi:hypothetical protein